MEYIPKPHERETPSPSTSPTTATNGVSGGQTPKPATPRSDPSPYPTTFVQADTASFKQVVQMLTGSSEPTKPSPSPAPAPAPTPPPQRQHSQIPPKRQGFKLYERRNNNSLKNALMINTLNPSFSGGGFSPRSKPPEILSPSVLDFPSLTLSPVTPLQPPPPGWSSPSCSSASEEERAIAEKGFFLSSAGTPRDAEPPQLLSLFPVTSPRVSGEAASS